ncbi:MAG: 3-deoxy-7-phosphoheptulonate synthase [Spirochaetia bacterium]|jgi:3-deoxy-7-phosphoheptulonate synthase|nr:3-deoxy-7-phosphoheptulonate synthase [Spirochaetia bacterium]
MKAIDDLHIKQITPLISPEELKKDFSAKNSDYNYIIESRNTITNILERKDDRLLAIVGPCSIHDTVAGLEYAEKLKELSRKIDDEIFPVMRVYFEKPRTTIGWRGLIMDPDMDDTYDIQKGLHFSREFLLKIAQLELPTGTEMLDPIIPQYISDLISWAAVGARTSESQTHRSLASGMSIPVGFKNGTGGNLNLAVNAINTAMHPSSFIGIDQQGNTCILRTEGNRSCHLILRGGTSGPNYYEEDVEESVELMVEARIDNPSVIIDCSHANSGKKHTRQRRVFRSVLDQVLHGQKNIAGIMMESNLFEGNQKFTEKFDDLKYGVSITDSCIGWNETEEILLSAAEDLRNYRKNK